MCLAIGSVAKNERKLSLPGRILRWLAFWFLLARMLGSGVWLCARQRVAGGRG